MTENDQEKTIMMIPAISDNENAAENENEGVGAVSPEESDTDLILKESKMLQHEAKTWLSPKEKDKSKRLISVIKLKEISFRLRRCLAKGQKLVSEGVKETTEEEEYLDHEEHKVKSDMEKYLDKHMNAFNLVERYCSKLGFALEIENLNLSKRFTLYEGKTQLLKYHAKTLKNLKLLACMSETISEAREVVFDSKMILLEAEANNLNLEDLLRRIDATLKKLENKKRISGPEVNEGQKKVKKQRLADPGDD